MLLRVGVKDGGELTQGDLSLPDLGGMKDGLRLELQGYD